MKHTTHGFSQSRAYGGYLLVDFVLYTLAEIIVDYAVIGA